MAGLSCAPYTWQRWFAHINPEPEQFAVDTGRAPQRIGDAHLPD
jgi:hypothetical protein